MKILALFPLLLVFPLAAQQDRRPVPYEMSEFPEWAHDVRRFEVVLIGTFPITMLLSSLALDMVANIQEGNGLLDPQPTNAQTIAERLALSLSLSGALAITDLIINRHQISEQRRKRQELLRQLDQQDADNG